MKISSLVFFAASLLILTSCGSPSGHENPAPKSKSDVVPSSVPLEDDSTLKIMAPKQVVLRVTDENILRSLLANENLSLQKGHVLEVSSLVPPLPFCTFTSIKNFEGDANFSNGTELVISQKKEKQIGLANRFQAIFEGKNFGIGCIKFSAADFTREDLSDALNPIFEVIIKK